MEKQSESSNTKLLTYLIFFKSSSSSEVGFHNSFAAANWRRTFHIVVKVLVSYGKMQCKKRV